MKHFGLGKIVCIVAVFCVTTSVVSPAQTFTTLVHFNGTDGSDPAAALIQGEDGNFYGTTSAGGVSNTACDNQSCGTLFKMTPAGKVTTLYSFCSQTDCNDGASPGQILLGPDGNIYGFTRTGGANCHTLDIIGCGTIFKATLSGTVTILYSLCTQTNCLDGWGPDSLVLGRDGNFYGTAFNGGTLDKQGYSFGTFFKITPEGVFTAIRSFCTEGGISCLDGGLPENLVQANGNFYGATYQGGTSSNSCGIVFEITPNGKLTVVHNFELSEGCFGHSSLIAATDGNFYGTNDNGGGPHRRGTAYQLTPAGELTLLYRFCELTYCADGEFPQSGLVQATDGNFYGTTEGSLMRPVKDGTVFELTSDGTLTTLFTFDSETNPANGAGPVASLLQATDGSFYGTTHSGGGNSCFGVGGCGTAFTVSTGLAPFVAPNPGFGKVGDAVMILGNNLTGTTSVTFNGTAATFTVVSGTYIKAEVPTGATTGTIEVTTPSGTLNSNVAFQVVP